MRWRRMRLDIRTGAGFGVFPLNSLGLTYWLKTCIDA